MNQDTAMVWGSAMCMLSVPVHTWSLWTFGLGLMLPCVLTAVRNRFDQ